MKWVTGTTSWPRSKPRGGVRCPVAARTAAMDEYAEYQALLVEGALIAARIVLLTTARRRFGQPDPDSRATLAGLTSIESIEKAFDRLDTASSWQEILAGL